MKIIEHLNSNVLMICNHVLIICNNVLMICNHVLIICNNVLMIYNVLNPRSISNNYEC